MSSHSARSGEAVSRSGILSRFGVRGRLLLAFFGISAFGVLGAGVALYSFHRIDHALALITQRRVPVALISQDLSRHMERILAAAPELLAATTPDEKARWSVRISTEVNTLTSLLTNLREAGYEDSELAWMEPYVERLRDNLGELNRLINTRLDVGAQKKDLLRKELEVAGAMQQLLGPWAAVMDGKIAQWRSLAVNPAVPAERRLAADREFEESLSWFRSLQQSQFLASYINDMLQRAASTDDGNGLTVAAFRLQQALRELERSTLELDPRLQHPMVDLIGQLRPFSSAGKGSTFTVTLPNQGVAPAVGQAPGLAPAADGRATVLVVDDDPTMVSLLGKTLEKEGYRVISASNGVEALSLARQHRPQAITLDVLMPQMDGWRALKELKADAMLRDIPVIMVTVLNERGMAIPLGAADFMTKPVDRQRLTALLREHCPASSDASILVVEDDLPTREALCRMLTGMGYAAHAAVNGRSALDWLDSHPAPSLILLDLMMPEMDGFEFLRELRKGPAFAEIPVIVVTAKELTAEDFGVLRGQAERIIAKDPSYLIELAAAVRGRLARQPVQEAERIAD